MTEAELAVEARRFEEAGELLEQLRRAGHRHIAVLRLSLRVATALAQWEEVLRLARQLRKHKALSVEQAQPILRRAHIERLRELAGDGDALAGYWSEIPTAELDDRRMVEQALPMLAAAGRAALARKTLEKLLDAEWDSALARLYGHCANGEAVACLARGEGWLRAHPKDAGLLHALGRLCLAAQLWGKAQSYLEASLTLEPSVETHLALAGLLERLERGSEAQAHYRAAAQRADV
jgi:HemY protein